MKNISCEIVKGTEKKSLQEYYFIPKNKQINKITFQGDIPFNFIYTSLDPKLEHDFNELKNNNNKTPNGFIFAQKLFSLALKQLLSSFASPKDLSCFANNHSINIFLARDFDELCSIGSNKKLNLPPNVNSWVFKTTLIYLQKFFLDGAIEFKKQIPKKRFLKDTHELLHIFSYYNRTDTFNVVNQELPLFIEEGLATICAKQFSTDFKGEFISSDILFMEKEFNPFDYDKKWITENAVYQSASHFMNYLITSISKKENLSYKEGFQKVFSVIDCPESFEGVNNNFNMKKYFKKKFNINIIKEYKKFKGD